MGLFALGFILGAITGIMGYHFQSKRRNKTKLVSSSVTDQPARISVADLLGEENAGDRTAELRQNLLRKYMFDEKKIDNALALERERTPGANMEQLMEAAIERWERDNRT